MHGFNYLFYLAYYFVFFSLPIVALVLPLPLPLIGTTGLVLGDLAVDPEGGLSLLRPWCGWLWHMRLPPTAFHLCWCGSVSRHVVRNSPRGPNMVGSLCCRLRPGRGLQPSSVPASSSQVQPLGARVSSLASTVPQQPGSMATQTVVAGAALPQPTTKETPTLVLPISGLLGIPVPLVAKIKEGKFINLGDLLPEALEWAFRALH